MKRAKETGVWLVNVNGAVKKVAENGSNDTVKKLKAEGKIAEDQTVVQIMDDDTIVISRPDKDLIKGDLKVEFDAAEHVIVDIFYEQRKVGAKGCPVTVLRSTWCFQAQSTAIDDDGLRKMDDGWVAWRQLLINFAPDKYPEKKADPDKKDDKKVAEPDKKDDAKADDAKADPDKKEEPKKEPEKKAEPKSILDMNDSELDSWIDEEFEDALK
jgi:hypothetical protein